GLVLVAILLSKAVPRPVPASRRRERQNVVPRRSAGRGTAFESVSPTARQAPANEYVQADRDPDLGVGSAALRFGPEGPDNALPQRNLQRQARTRVRESASVSTASGRI